jgi:hypothetical protein
MRLCSGSRSHASATSSGADAKMFLSSWSVRRGGRVRARVATFQVDDSAKLDQEIATTQQYLKGGKLPDGIPATGS